MPAIDIKGKGHGGRAANRDLAHRGASGRRDRSGRAHRRGAAEAVELTAGQCAGATRVDLAHWLRLGWIATLVRAGQSQHRAVDAIGHAGGWVIYDSEWDQRAAPSSWRPHWPKWMIDFFGIDVFHNVVFVNLHDRGTDLLLAQVAPEVTEATASSGTSRLRCRAEQDRETKCDFRCFRSTTPG